ncbi:MAG: YggS family pyridoxal phosphate-dependent enzyme [Bacillota bacterium]|nr:YggS family pyridoxal phosphate-dependent enzyme [Bacillota bacterium]
MSIKEKVEEIQTNLPKNVTLIAVSKTRTLDEIKEVYNAGIRIFGENKVQELIDKIENADFEAEWHLIGHLQTNKVKYIAGKVELIHSLDSIKLLNEIEKVYSKKSLTAKVLIQINIGEEESKTGINLSELESIVQASEDCKNVKVMGLMAVIPQGNKAECRYYFSKMNKIFLELKERKFNNIEMKYLSMGMTNDYKYAVSEGSNMVRIGEGIFGKRFYNIK